MCMFYFFFYWSGAHRDLHSFPTRRSSDLLVHDETDPLIAYMLAHLWWPDFPVPVGIVRNLTRPTHDQMLNDQIAQATEARGSGDLEKLLSAGETWTVE